jgi:hypothetical protein
MLLKWAEASANVYVFASRRSNFRCVRIIGPDVLFQHQAGRCGESGGEDAGILLVRRQGDVGGW